MVENEPMPATGFQPTAPAAKEHTTLGILSLIFGIIGIVIIWVPIINFGSLICAIIAIVTGYMARKEDDGFGLIGLILGIVALVLGIVFVIIAATAYMYITSMMPSGF